MKQYKPVIIFDMDGVLFDSEPLHVRFEEIFLLEMGVSLTNSQKKELIGLAGNNMWKFLKETYGLKLPVEDLVKTDMERRLKFFKENITTKMPGAEDLLIRLKIAGFRMSLASSSQLALIDLQLTRAGFECFFENTVSGYMVKKGKPAPDIFLYTARLMDTDPKDCLVIEDSQNGIRASIAAGMKCIGYSGYHHIKQDLAGADILVDDLDCITVETINDIFNSRK